MQTCVTISSTWQQLRNREINCEQALHLLVNERGIVNLNLLDKDVSSRFFREFPDRSVLPPVIPLLLWRNCYFLGSPVTLSTEDIKKLSARTLTNIKIIPIADKSYRSWFLTQNFNANSINSTSVVNPLTGETEQENISEVTELHLSKAADQISRIKTIISGALRNRASDIHLEPMSDGLRVRYRIDAWRRGRGCSNCFNSGYLGREAIVELLNVDDTVRQLIYEGTMTQLHRYLGQSNFESFRVAAIEKVTTGVTTLTEVLRVLPHSALSRKSWEELKSISSGCSQALLVNV